MGRASERTPADLDLEVRLAVYRDFVATGGPGALKRHAGVGLKGDFWDPEFRA